MNNSKGKSEGYDVIVVGSGASGGWACKRLAEAGLKVALLEAGKPQSDTNFTEHKPAFELKYRNRATETLRKTRPVQSIFDVCNEYTKDWFVNDLEEPYTTPKDQPYLWMGRLRVTGGRTNVWGRVSLRFSDWDFKAASHDGFGEDWPMSARRAVPAADAVQLPGDIGPQSSEREIWADGDAGPFREYDQAAEWTRALSLLRALRAGLRDALVLQFGVYHRGGCAANRELHDDFECHGAQGIGR